VKVLGLVEAAISVARLHKQWVVALAVDFQDERFHVLEYLMKQKFTPDERVDFFSGLNTYNIIRFDSEQECRRFYNIFNHPTLYSTTLYAALIDYNGNNIYENT
jgi:hypothetical protein